MNNLFLFSFFGFMYLFSLSSILQQRQFPSKVIESQLREEMEDSVRVVALLDLSVQFQSNDYKKSLDLAKEAYDIAIGSKNKNLIKITNLQLGKLFFYKGSYETALDFYISLLKLAENEKDFEWIGKANYQLGGVRLVMEDYDLAEKHFNIAKDNFIKHFQDENSFSTAIKIGFCNNFGLIFSGRGSFEEAKLEFQTGINLARQQMEFYPSLIQLLNNMGDVLVKENDFEQAKYFYEEAISYIGIFPNVLMEAMLYNSLGKLQLKLQDYSMSYQFLKKGYNLAKSAQGYSHLKHLSENLSTVYGALGKTDSALFYLKLMQVYSDSLNLKKSAEKITSQELFYQFAEEKASMETFYGRNRAYLLFLLFGIILLSGFFFIKNFRLKRNLQFTLEEKILLEKKAELSGKENEDLRSKIIENQKELTLVAMNNIYTNNLLNKLTVTFDGDKFSNMNSIERDNLIKLIQELKNNKGDKAFAEFEFRFNKIYVGFFEKLLKDFPELTVNERRLAAFLKLQLTTKEIITITGQSVRAVEIGRTRLRKKLELTKSNKNLNDFFVEY
jgi:tetratricopeptide (TPR) repeat protein